MTGTIWLVTAAVLQEFSTLIKMPLNEFVFTLSNLLQAKGSCSSISAALANLADLSWSRVMHPLRKTTELCQPAELWGSTLQQRDDKKPAWRRCLQNGHLSMILDPTAIKMEIAAPSEVTITWRFLG